MFKRLIAPAFAALLAVSAPLAAQTAAPPSPEERARIESIIRDYLLKNPEILQEALVELEKRQAQAEDRARAAAFSANREALYRSPNQIVLGNPQGDITLVEFFDYNCGFCKRALPETLELLRSDTRLRVVLKDFPVLGQGSVEAAQVAVALKMQFTAAKYLEFHQKLLGGRGQANGARAMEVAREVGADMTRLQRDMQSPQVRDTLAENMRLAELLRINGTPTYVVGDEVVVGAVGLEKLRENLARARTACAARPNMC